MVKEPLSGNVQQLELLGEEVHVVLVFPLAAGNLLESEGAIARVVGGNVPAPGPEGADVQDRYRTGGVQAAVHEAAVTRVRCVVVLELPIEVVQAVVLAAALVLDHAIVAGGSLVRLVVVHVHAAMRPVLVVVQGCPVGEVRVGPPGWHLLLEVDEELPCVLGQIGLPDDPLRRRGVVHRPRSPQVSCDAPASIEDHPLAIGCPQPHALLVQSDDLVVDSLPDDHRVVLRSQVYSGLDGGCGAVLGPVP